MTHGDHIRKARTAHGMTQRQLAGKLGVHDMAISRWERNAVEPSYEHRVAIAEVLGIDPGLLDVGPAPASVHLVERLDRIERWLQAIHEDCNIGHDPDTTRSNAS